MRNALKKLKSEKGVSILMAILFMLVATMVISVILAAAVTAAKNFAAEKKQQQAYLTVSSAAVYMRDEIASYSSTYTVKKDSAGSIISGSEEIKYDVDNTIEDSCQFAPLMNAAIEAFDDDGLTENYVEDFTLNLSSTIQDQRGNALFAPVYVHFVMDAADRDINITLTIYENDQKNKEDILYQITITLPADSWTRKTRDKVGDVVTTTETTKWTWAEGNVVRG